MPSKSESQRKLFAMALHSPSKLSGDKKELTQLPSETLREFSVKSPTTKRLAKRFSKRGAGKSR